MADIELNGSCPKQKPFDKSLLLTQPNTTGCAGAVIAAAKDCDRVCHARLLLTRFPHEGIASYD